MKREAFEEIIAREFSNAIPERFVGHIRNVAFLVEDEPSEEVRRQENLRKGETLLGYYHGIPYPLRGHWYGMGETMPDTITLYQKPIEEEAAHLVGHGKGVFEDMVCKVVRETIWHEVAHLFGMEEHTVQKREHFRDHHHEDGEECENCSA